MSYDDRANARPNLNDESDVEEEALVNDYREQVNFDDGMSELDRTTSLGGSQTQDLQAQLDYMDRLLKDGIVGGPQPNVVDLQLGASLALLKTVEDLRPIVEKHPVDQLANLYFSDFPGKIKRGVIPPGWLVVDNAPTV